MSDADNLETLSNAEIRSKCLQLGLPNVPVTDSSRKVLIKKIRVSLGGGATPAQATPKKVNRRETLNPKRNDNASVEANDAETKNEQRADTPNRKRRTIAVTTSAKEASPAPGGAAAAGAPVIERRRSVREQMLNKVVTESVAERQQDPILEIDEAFQPLTQPLPAAGRIQQRRVSTQSTDSSKSAGAAVFAGHQPVDTIQEQQEPVEIVQAKAMEPQRRPVSKLPQPTSSISVERRPVLDRAASAAALKQNTLFHNSMIVLESDDDEDEVLAVAAQQAEERNNERKLASDIMQRASKLVLAKHPESGGLATKSYGTEQQQQIKPPIYTSQMTQRDHLGSIMAKSYMTSNYLSSQSLSTVAATSTAPRSSYLSTAPTITTTAQRPYTYTHEFSDEAEEDDDDGEGAIETPFLSSFARNLERLKAEPLGGGGTPRNRYTLSGQSATANYNFEPSLRRPLRRPQSGFFVNAWLDLDRKYHLKTKLLILSLLILLILLYVIFF